MTSTLSTQTTSCQEYQQPIALKWTLSAFIFFIPISNSAQSIALVAAIVLLLLYKTNLYSLSELIKKPWVIALLGLVGFVLLGCLWSPATGADKLLTLHKYAKLLCLPLLCLGFTDKSTREWGIHAFLAAMALTCLLAIAKTLSPTYLHNDIPGAVFRNYIMTGNMMALASYVAAFFAIKKPRFRLFYGFLFLLFSIQVLFLNIGRTGYIMYLLLMLLLTCQLTHKKQIGIGLLAIICMGLLSFHFNFHIQQRFQAISRNISYFYLGKKNTSVGYRIQFHQFAFNLFRENPLIGQGTGSFSYYFKKRQPVPEWGKQLSEPHSQYWLIAAEFGLLGLGLYVGFLITLYLACWRLHEMKNIGIALLLSFSIGCFSDSLLFYFSSGYFFLTLMALVLGEATLAADKAHLKKHLLS